MFGETSAPYAFGGPRDMRIVALSLCVLFGCQSSLDALDLAHSELVPLSDEFGGGMVLRANQQDRALLVWMNDFGSSAPNPERPLGLLLSEYSAGTWKDPTGPADARMWSEWWQLPPRAALSENGDVVVIGFNADGSSVFHRVAGAWQSPFSLPFSGPTKVELDDVGNIVIAYVGEWACGSLRCSGVFRSEYREGQWSHPAGPEDAIGVAPPAGSQAPFGLALSVAGTGEAAIAWAQEDFVGTGSVSVTRSVYVSERGPGGWSDPNGINARISPPGALVVDPPRVGLSEGGDLVVLWRDLQQGLRIAERRGAAVGPPSLAPSIVSSGSAVTDYDLVVAADGTALVAFSSPGSIGLLEHRGGGWSTILPDGAGWKTAAESLSAATNPDGAGALAWSGRHGNYQRIYRAEREDGEWVFPAGPEDHISPPDSDAGYPLVARGAAADFSVWLEMRGFRAEWSPPFRLRRYWVDP